MENRFFVFLEGREGDKNTSPTLPYMTMAKIDF